MQNKDSCSFCTELNQKYSATSPIKLTKLLKKIFSFKEQGIIEEINIASEYFTPIDDIIKNGWSDIIYSEFECNYCGKKFELSADTYHGNKNNAWVVK